MFYGWTGNFLEIDLSSGNIERKEGDRTLYENYLGSKGTNARTLWERVPPEVEAFSPDNPLIIGTGVLTGTMVPSANRAVISFRSPQTGLHMHSAIGGFWPSELKFAGYDSIIISGKSPSPVYIWIHNDAVEIRDARHLRGKSPFETRRIIRKDLQNDRIHVISIGLAGENKVYGASIEDAHGSSASRGGIGALMGDKNLKAIAVYGTKDIYIAKPSRFNELCEHILNRTEPLRDYLVDFSSRMNMANMQYSFFGNLNETLGELNPDVGEDINTIVKKCQDFIDCSRIKEIACHNCGVRCKHVYHRPDGGPSFIKCQSWWAFMVSAKIIDFEFALKCYYLCEEYGLDAVSVARYIAFAIDLYEKGILTQKETDGMHLEWGNREVVLSLIEKIVRREGPGDLLADGIRLAAQRIGKGAEKHAHHTKGIEFIPASAIFTLPFFALVQSISDKGDATRNMSEFTMGPWILPREDREAYIKSGYCLYPSEYDKYVLSEFDWTGDDREAGCQIAIYDEETFTISDLAGLCNFWSVYFPGAPINRRDIIAELISCATGKEYDDRSLTRIARRIINLIRAYNVRLGTRRKDDTVPAAFFKRATPEIPLELDPEKFNTYIDRFYELRGWNSDGIPTKEMLHDLDLQFVTRDLEKRGIV